VNTRSSSREPGRRGIVFTALVALGIQLGAFWMVCVLSGNVIRESERQTAAVAARSAALRVQLQKLTFGILTADAAATNFLLTGKEDALTPFRKANDAAPGLVGAIERLCEGHIDELDRIHRISSLSDAAFDRLSDLRQYAGDAKTKPPEAAVAAAHKAVQSLISAVAAFQESESRGLAQSLNSIGHSATLGQQNVTDLGGALAIGGGVLSTIILVAVVLRRERRLLAAYAPVGQAMAMHPETPPVLSQAAAPAAPPLLQIATHSTREVVEFAVIEVQETAAARSIAFRAEIGPAWDYTVGGNSAALQQVIVGIFEAIIGCGPPGGPVTLSCIEQPGRMVRLQFQFLGKLHANQLPEALLAQARNLPGTSIRGSETGVMWLEFPSVPNIADLAALRNAAQSTIGIASPA